MVKKRSDNQLPVCVTEWGWKYHHLGIPVIKEKRGEKYIRDFGLFVSGFESSPFGIEWMRYEENSPVAELIQTVPHVAFEVNNIEDEILRHKLKVIYGPESNTAGIKVAMIEHDGAPVELIEFDLIKETKI